MVRAPINSDDATHGNTRLEYGPFERIVWNWTKKLLPNAVLVPIAAAAIFLIRCVAVSNADLNTAKVVLNETTLSNALFVVFLSILPFTGLIFSTIIGVLTGESLRVRTYQNIRTLIYYSAGLAIIAGPILLARSNSLNSFSYWTYHLAFAVGTIYGYMLSIRLPIEAMKRRKERVAIALTMGLTLVVFAYMSALSSREMWLPKERIQLNGMNVIVGYVLSSDDGRLVVLNHWPRVITIIKDDDIVSRTFCPSSGNCDSPIDPSPRNSPSPSNLDSSEPASPSSAEHS